MTPKAPFEIAQHDPAPQADHAVPAEHAVPAHQASTPVPQDESAAFMEPDPHDAHAAHDGHGHEAHGHDAHASEPGKIEIDKLIPEEIPNIYTVLSSFTQKDDHHGHGHDEGHGHHGPFFIDPIFCMLIGGTFLMVVRKIIARSRIENPSKPQVAIEALFGGLLGFFGDILGKEHARRFIPYIGSIWIYIWINNLAGLVPGLKSSTGHFQMTIALGICTFFYVTWAAVTSGGWKHFFWHLAGSPSDFVTWALAPLMFVLELVAYCMRPISLALRLWGNIMGEDRLLATFLGLGVVIAALVFGTPNPGIGVPLHLPFFFLVLLGSTIQATVFAMLSSVYIALMLPHDHHDHDDHGHGHDEAHGHGHEKADHAAHGA